MVQVRALETSLLDLKNILVTLSYPSFDDDYILDHHLSSAKTARFSPLTRNNGCIGKIDCRLQYL
jgi:hypothetical protein